MDKVKIYIKPQTNPEIKITLTQFAKLISEDETKVIICNQTEPLVCQKECTGCEGQTHHWYEDFIKEIPVWICKHCSHTILYNEPTTHPAGCDCPDCQEEHLSDF